MAQVWNHPKYVYIGIVRLFPLNQIQFYLPVEFQFLLFLAETCSVHSDCISLTLEVWLGHVTISGQWSTSKSDKHHSRAEAVWSLGSTFQLSSLLSKLQNHIFQTVLLHTEAVHQIHNQFYASKNKSSVSEARDI